MQAASANTYARLSLHCSTMQYHGRIQRGDRGSGTPLKNQENIGFLSKTGPDPLKNHKASKPQFNVGPSSARQRNAINGVSLTGR